METIKDIKLRWKKYIDHFNENDYKKIILVGITNIIYRFIEDSYDIGYKKGFSDSLKTQKEVNNNK